MFLANKKRISDFCLTRPEQIVTITATRLLNIELRRHLLGAETQGIGMNNAVSHAPYPEILSGNSSDPTSAELFTLPRYIVGIVE